MGWERAAIDMSCKNLRGSEGKDLEKSTLQEKQYSETSSSGCERRKGVEEGGPSQALYQGTPRGRGSCLESAREDTYASSLSTFPTAQCYWCRGWGARNLWFI